ncbi:taste receptor type 2 member 40-like [Discoglossus pictus]
MHPTDFVVFVVLFEAEVIAGILISTFIVIVNFLDWSEKKMLSSCDQILLALGISNACYPWFSGCLLYICFVQPQSILANYFPVVYALTISAFLSSSWITALLCLYYFVKIVQFPNGLLVRLKMKIDLLVPWLILVVNVVSILSSIPMALNFSNVYSNVTNPITGNISSVTSWISNNSMQIVSPLIPNFLVPFLTVMVTTCCIMRYLSSHTRNMEQNMGEAGNLKVHRRAARTMLSLILLYLVFYVAQLVLVSSVQPQLGLQYCVTCVLVLACSPLQSVILILGNNKLIQQYRTLYHYMSCKEDAKETGP